MGEPLSLKIAQWWYLDSGRLMRKEENKAEKLHMETQKAGETDGQTNDNSFIDPHSTHGCLVQGSPVLVPFRGKVLGGQGTS